MTAAEKTMQWVETFVVHHALCPFAAAPVRAQKVAALEINAEDEEEAFFAALTQVQKLLDEDRDTLETSLLVFPTNLLADFSTFLDFVYTLEDALAETGADQLVQLAHFRPNYRFDGVAEDDPGNLTNRSPYPVIQLLRTESVAAAVAAYPGVAEIPERNVDKMREVFGN